LINKFQSYLDIESIGLKLWKVLFYSLYLFVV
jgi:hypothetical protein